MRYGKQHRQGALERSRSFSPLDTSQRLGDVEVVLEYAERFRIPTTQAAALVGAHIAELTSATATFARASRLPAHWTVCAACGSRPHFSQRV